MNKTKQTVIINGRAYDAATGLVIEAPKPQAPKVVHAAVKKQIVINDIGVNRLDILPKKPATRPARVTAPHAQTQPQKSTTLRRDVLKKPVSTRRPSATKTPRRIERSQQITRFAPTDHSHKPDKKVPDQELVNQARELQKAHAIHLKKQTEPKPHISSRAVKEHLLKTQLDQAPDQPHHEVFQAGRLSRRARLMSVASTSLALVLLGGYLTYINIPNLSIRVAAANAGVDASLPQYQPAGYRIHGPIAYTSGQVEVNYQQNGGNRHYTITQKTTDWDPQATLDNYVQPESKDNYQIRSTQGLTVYTYDNKAVWVNGGVLHVIDGDAPLSGQQVERIAASM